MDSSAYGVNEVTVQTSAFPHGIGTAGTRYGK